MGNGITKTLTLKNTWNLILFFGGIIVIINFIYPNIVENISDIWRGFIAGIISTFFIISFLITIDKKIKKFIKYMKRGRKK